MKLYRIGAVVLAGAICLFLVSPAWAATPRTFFSILLGGSEVSDEGTSNTGDPNGRGSATILVDSDRGMLCFAITVTGVGAPSAAHIHKNVAGQNGNIVVTLVQPSAGSPGASSGCVSGVGAGLLNSIKNNPAGFYVNVHTDEFPAGAVRGQLF